MFWSSRSKVDYFSNIVSVQGLDTTVDIVSFFLVATEPYYREICFNQSGCPQGRYEDRQTRP